MDNLPLLRISYSAGAPNQPDLLIPISPNGNSLKLVKNIIADQLFLDPTSMDLYVGNEQLSDDISISDIIGIFQTGVHVQFKPIELGSFVTVLLKYSKFPIIRMKIDQNTTAHQIAYELSQLFLNQTTFSLFLEGKLLDQEQIICNLDLEGKTFDVFPKIMPVLPNSWCVRLRPMEGVPHCVVLPASSSVSELKLAINQVYSHYEPTSTVLILNGRQLREDSRKLNEIENFHDQSQIRIVKQPTRQGTIPVSLMQQQGQPIPISMPQVPTREPSAATRQPASEPTIRQPTTTQFPGGLMMGTVSIDITPGNAIDPNSMQSIVSNLARSITDSLIPQIQQATARSSPTLMDEESLLRIEIDSIRNEYKEFLRLLHEDDSIESDNNPLVVLGRIVRHMETTGLPLLWSKISTFVQCCVERRESEEVPLLCDLISRFQKIFGYISNIVKAFKFENGQVSFTFQPAQQIQPQVAVQSGPFISFPGSSEGLFRSLLVPFLQSISQERNATMVRQIISLPIHPILAQFFDSFSLQDLLAFFSPTATNESKYRFLTGALASMIELLNNCFLRSRPFSAECLVQEAEAFWFFMQNYLFEFDASPLKNTFTELFCNFWKCVNDHSTDPNSSQVKLAFAQKICQLFAESWDKFVLILRENVQLAVSIFRCLAQNQFVVQFVFDMLGCRLVERYGSVAYSNESTSVAQSPEPSELIAKRRKGKSIDEIIESVQNSITQAQLREFIKYDKDGFFDGLLQ